MATKMLTRGEIQELINEKALKDENFRDLLIANPKEALESIISKQFPAKMNVKSVEETADTIYVIVPQKDGIAEGDEVPEITSEMVDAGIFGGGDTIINCQSNSMLSFATKIEVSF